MVGQDSELNNTLAALLSCGSKIIMFNGIRQQWNRLVEFADMVNKRMSGYPIVMVLVCLVAGPIRAEERDRVSLANLKDWHIVVAEEAIASEIYAAEEFRYFFKGASGVQLPVVYQLARPDRYIFIGPRRLMRASSVGFSVEAMNSEDLRILVRGNNIAIAGGRPHGTLYGVYKFFEDYLGVRFLTPDHIHIPPLADRHLPGLLDVFYHPPFGHYRLVGSRSAEFSVRQRDKYYRNDPKFGGFTPYHVINHSLLKQIPLEVYSQTHPEYYYNRHEAISR